MSTPSTATLHFPQHYGYSHHQNYPPTSSNYPASSSHNSTFLPNATTSSSSIKVERNNNFTMPSTSASQSKKRQRSREPDWNNFYKNGLPKEVIVIHDTPSPPRGLPESAAELKEASSAMKQSTRSTAANSSTKQPVKKRKRDDGAVAYDAIYPPNSNTPYQNGSNSASTISTDRTTSAINTTAATSLGSQYSHNAEGNRNTGAFETDPQAGSNKRKRVATRAHILNEAKRKEVELRGDAYSSYKAPPRPPIKCGDVEVPVKTDVSLGLPIQHLDQH